MEPQEIKDQKTDLLSDYFLLHHGMSFNEGTLDKIRDLVKQENLSKDNPVRATGAVYFLDWILSKFRKKKPEQKSCVNMQKYSELEQKYS